MLTRRTFLRAIGASSLAGLGPRAAASQAPVARTVTVTDGAAWAGPGWGDADLDPTVVRGMLERALVELTAAPDALAAVRQILPVSDPAQRYGIKVNCVNQDLPTHPTVVGGLVDLMVEAGVAAEQIVVFDRSLAELQRGGFHAGGAYATCASSSSFDDAYVALSDASVRLSRIVTQQVDHLINVPVLKNHQMAGVTLALKNHFGSIDQPSSLHGRANDGCPGIAELCAQPWIRDRTRLVLIDATFATHISGLGAKPDWAPMSLVAALDPVAADAVGQELINERRLRDGLARIDARHIREAASLGLGVADLELIDARRLVIHPVPDKAKPWEQQAGEPGGCSAAGEGLLGAAAALLWRKRNP